MPHGSPDHNQHWNDQTHRRSHANDIMNEESASSFEKLVDHLDDGVPTLKQLLTVSRRLMEASDLLSTELALNTALNPVNYK